MFYFSFESFSWTRAGRRAWLLGADAFTSANEDDTDLAVVVFAFGPDVPSVRVFEVRRFAYHFVGCFICRSAAFHGSVGWLEREPQAPNQSSQRTCGSLFSLRLLTVFNSLIHAFSSTTRLSLNPSTPSGTVSHAARVLTILGMCFSSMIKALRRSFFAFSRLYPA